MLAGFLLSEAPMKTSDRGVALIKAHEGLRLQAYQDPVGVWTIGVGHTTAAGPPKVERGMKITEAGADAILRQDLAKFEGYVSSAVKVPLNQNEFDALVSFTFNLGPGNLRSSTLLKKLNSGDRAGAADEFGKWTRAGGKVLPGLVKRREAERALFRTPIADLRPAPKPVPVIDTLPPQPARSGPPTMTLIALVVFVALLAVFLLKG